MTDPKTLARFILDCLLFARDNEMPGFDNQKCIDAARVLSPISNGPGGREQRHLVRGSE